MTFNELFALYFQSPALAILHIRRLLARNEFPPALYQEAMLRGANPQGFNPTPMQAPSEQTLLARLIAAFASQPQSTICGPTLTARAEEILLGTVMYPDYLRLAVYEGPLVLIDLRSMLDAGYAPVPGIIVKATAACALPLDRIDVLLGFSPLDVARQKFAELAARAASLGASSEAVPLWLAALDAAELTPEPQDDVQALTQLTALLSKLPMEDGHAHSTALRRMQQAFVFLVDTPSVQEAIVPVVARAIGLASNLPPALREVETMYASAMEGLYLAKQIAGPQAVFLATLTARSLARTGSVDRAIALLTHTEALCSTDAEKLEHAQARLDPCFGPMSFEALRTLGNLVDHASTLSTKERLNSLQMVISHWPGTQEGVGRYIVEFTELAKKLEDRERVPLVMNVAIKCYQNGAIERVHPLLLGISASAVAAAASTLPSTLKPLVEELLIATREARAATTIDAPLPKTALQRLAAEQRFRDTALSQQQESERWRAAGFNHIADIELATAAKTWYFSGDSREALKLFEQSMASFEARAAQLQQAAKPAPGGAPTVARADWFLAWAQQYTYAAFAALECEQPNRALAFAEAARFHAGTFAQNNALDVTKLIAKLAAQSAPTVLLYSICAANRLKFLCVDRSSVRELVMDETDATAVLAACQQYLSKIRDQLTDKPDPAWIEAQINTLLEAVGAPMFTLVEQALTGIATKAGLATKSRLLWIGHGPLAVIPLGACEKARKSVLELAAVLEIASLQSDSKESQSAPGFAVASASVHEATDSAEFTTALASVRARWPIAPNTAAAFVASFRQQISRNTAPPEALRIASLWLRNATTQQVTELLPLPDQTQTQANVDSTSLATPFSAPASWGGFMHWGAAGILRS